MSGAALPGAAMRILLIGADGQVGRALRQTLAPLGRLLPLGRAQLDLERLDDVRRAVLDARPQLVVNAAAYTAVDRAEVEQDRAFAVNGEAPGVMAEAAAESGAALVHYSTDYVFGDTDTAPRREEHPPSPLSAYGRSKLAGERAVAAAGAPHLILRTSWVYGHGGKNFVETMLRLGAERETIEVVDDQRGAPTSARVIAECTAAIVATVRAAPAEQLRERGGLLHLACAGATTWLGFAEEIFAQAGRRGLHLRLEELVATTSAAWGAPARRPSNSLLDCSRLAERFDVRPPHWKVALETYFDSRPRGREPVGS